MEATKASGRAGGVRDADAPVVEGSRARAAVTLLVAGALVVVIHSFVGLVGFNPTDEGNLHAQTERILDGQVPHRDFVSPRPAGSGYLHTIDRLLPVPLFEASRIVGLAVIVAYSFVLARLIFGRRIHTWTATMIAGAAASSVVNLHTFPNFSWYTTDGLLLTGLGFVVLMRAHERDHGGLRILGTLLIGSALLTKQSFVLAPVVTLAWIWFGVDRDRPDRPRRFLVAGACMAAPILVYVTVIAALGGGRSMLEQLVGARPVYGTPIVTMIFDDPAYALALAAVLVVVFMTVRMLRRGTGLAFIALLVVFITALPITDGYSRGPWGPIIAWTAAAVVAWRSVARRSVDWPGVFLLSMAWMAALSWGWEVPNVVAGSLGLLVVHRIASSTALPRSRFTALGAISVSAAVIISVIVARADRPYYDRSSGSLTADLGALASDLAGIRSTPLTLEHLRVIQNCIRRYPASRVAVLPDNAAIYPVFGVTNPFPLDWWLPNETRGSEDRLLAVARRLTAEGDHLVLFHGYSAQALPKFETLPDPPEQGRPYGYGSPLLAQLDSILTGERVTCGPFAGWYQPGAG